MFLSLLARLLLAPAADTLQAVTVVADSILTAIYVDGVRANNDIKQLQAGAEA